MKGNTKFLYSMNWVHLKGFGSIVYSNTIHSSIIVLLKVPAQFGSAWNLFSFYHSTKSSEHALVFFKSMMNEHVFMTLRSLSKKKGALTKFWDLRCVAIVLGKLYVGNAKGHFLNCCILRSVMSNLSVNVTFLQMKLNFPSLDNKVKMWAELITNHNLADLIRVWNPK